MLRAMGGGMVVARAVVGPACGHGAIVEHRLAFDDDVDGSVDALERPQQHVRRLRVTRRPQLPGGSFGVTPRCERQGVANHEEACRGHPGRLYDHARQEVSPAGGNRGPRRRDAKTSGATIEECAEHARRVDDRQAQPLDIPGGCDESGDLTVRQECEVADRGKVRSGFCRAGPVARRRFVGGATIRIDVRDRHGWGRAAAWRVTWLARAGRRVARTTWTTALISARWVKACGKLPRWRPVAGSISPISTRAETSQNEQIVNVPSSPRSPSSVSSTRYLSTSPSTVSSSA